MTPLPAPGCIGEQDDDGGFGLRSGSVVNEAATGFCALALEPGAGRDRALDRLERSRAEFHPSTEAVPIDPDAVGWSWTTGTASWTEPTARALLALRLLRPAAPGIVAAVALLRDREAVGGGWNYGNRIVLDEELPPFAQTTAIALIGLVGLDGELERRGLASTAVALARGVEWWSERRDIDRGPAHARRTPRGGARPSGRWIG